MSTTSGKQESNDNNEPVPAAELSEQEQRQEEWYVLYEQLSQFLEQEPQKHPLYEFARQSMVDRESCDFYRGAYEDSLKVMRIVEACQTATAQKNQELGTSEYNWEDMFFDMMRLRIGLTTKRMLKRWPEEYLPNVVRDDALAKQKKAAK